MSGLNQTLNISDQSLFASRQGIDTTAHNIANAQTEGYSRQAVKINARDPILKQGLLVGSGAYVASIGRAHDRFIERQVNGAGSAHGESEGKYNAYVELEGLFSPELATNLSQQLDHFFDALQSLSGQPEEMTVRTAVKERGESLAQSFNEMDRSLKTFRDNSNEKLRASVDRLNELLENIAGLNLKIQETEYGEQRISNDLRDQRDRLVRDLSQYMDVNYYHDQFGMLTLRGAGSTLLVERGYASQFRTRRNDQGMYDLVVTDADGNMAQDVSRKIASGSLKAIIDTRDHTIGKLLAQNNDLAFNFAKEVNRVHKEGFGIGEFSAANSRNFFEELKDVHNAAQNIKIESTIQNSVNAIAAASTPEAVGDNVNINKLLDLRNHRFLANGTATFHEYFANNVGDLGTEAKRAMHSMEADRILFDDVTGRRESVAGVSMDEEASNMIRWQAAFTASSKLITTIDEMFQTVLSLK
ncbi:MAG: flagellar hook-associated protein FlgK [Deltaproteobacteria bacterium]|nr:flagellar hook-associated protein FlgK [Deltaproteobacteria bacterium]